MHQLTIYLWICSSFSRTINRFNNGKMTFFKDICGKLHWKAEMIFPSTLFVNFWVSEHGSGLKNWQFPISTEIYMGCYLEAIKNIELKFPRFSYLIDANIWSKFHQNLRMSLSTWRHLLKFIWNELYG